MAKVVRIGRIIPDWHPSGMDVYCSIDWDHTKGKLSISGVEGPTRGGNFIGGCGQIDMGYAHRNPDDDDKRGSLVYPNQIEFAPGWDIQMWYDFLDVWKKWHLNDMNAACEHQEALGWGKSSLVIYKWKMNSATCSESQKAKREVEDSFRKKIAIGPDRADYLRYMMDLPYSFTTPEATLDERLAQYYQSDGSETKTDGWVRPEEHPDGKLCAPCPQCGYKYGSAWLFRRVPDEVIEFLDSLPHADTTPAWV